MTEGGDRPALALGERGDALGVLVDAGSLFVEGDGVAFFDTTGRGAIRGGPMLLPGTRDPSVSGYTLAGGAGGFGVLVDDDRAINFMLVIPQ